MSQEIVRTHELAYKFFTEECGDERLKIHSQCVIDACLNMVENTDLDRKVFIIAGWLHDIGRKIDRENHQELGLESFARFLKKHSEFELVKDEVKDCIRNHRKNGNPSTIYGLIFKAADKIALKHKRWLDFTEGK